MGSIELFPTILAPTSSFPREWCDGHVDELQIRQALRSATSDVHERLHSHPGLASVQSGSIDTSTYSRLLGRLYGFHEPFERACRLAPIRSGWLASDLATFGIGMKRLATLPRCAGFPDFSSEEAIVGALYVVEGSALGGVTLARSLEGVVANEGLDGRRFFSGNQSRTGDVWRAYLSRLSNASLEGGDRATIISTATATFALFEQWLEGWNTVND